MTTYLQPTSFDRKFLRDMGIEPFTEPVAIGEESRVKVLMEDTGHLVRDYQHSKAKTKHHFPNRHDPED